MARYLETWSRQIPNRFKEKHLIELGSGCGIGGITACKLGANVLFTDLAKVIPITQKNLSHNLDKEVHKFEVCALEW